MIEEGGLDLSILFKNIPLLKEPYLKHMQNVKIIDVLSLLNLGKFLPDFKMALQKTLYLVNMTSPAVSNELVDVFAPLVEGGATQLGKVGAEAKGIKLTQETITKILDKLGKNDAPDAEKATYLLVLSGIFAKYSSSKFFGIENDSPIALRNFALALMNSALDLNKDVVPAEYLKNDKDDWSNKLIGSESAFTCTAVLAEIMLGVCKQISPLQVKSLFPPSWY